MSIPSFYPWQAAQWQSIAQLISAERLPHAILISGAEGSGKTDFALALAAYLLCEQPSATSACGQCNACQLLQAGSQPDLKRISPEEEKRQIRVDQVRELVEFCQQTAFAGGRKVAVISPAEAMNHSTANALLKTLEEPAGDSVILLVSHAPGRLLATIKSRCLSLEFPQANADLALDWLRPMCGEQSEALLAEAQGQPLLARALFDNDALALRQQFDQAFGGFIQQKLPLADMVDALVAADIDLVMDWLVARLQQLSRAAVGGEAAQQLEQAWQPLLSASPVWVLDRLEEVLRQRSDLKAGRNPNKRLLLEAQCLRFSEGLSA